MWQHSVPGHSTALGTTFLISELQKIQHLKAKPHIPAHLGTGNNCSAVTPRPQGCHQCSGGQSLTRSGSEAPDKSLAGLWLAQVTHRAQGRAAACNRTQRSKHSNAWGRPCCPWQGQERSWVAPEPLPEPEQPKCHPELALELLSVEPEATLRMLK